MSFRKRLMALSMALGLVAAVAAPALAHHTPEGEVFVPVYTETPVYLHCNGATKVSNLHALVDGANVSWDETKPTTSYTAGGGCGTADTFLEGTANQNPAYDFPMTGYYTGNIKNITIRLWGIDASGSRAFNEWDVDLHLMIDGVDILARPTVTTVPMIESSTGLSRLYEVTITDIGLSSKWDHEVEHEVQLTVYPKYIDGSGVVAWVYDAAEIDSGLVFNDTTPAAYTIPRT